MSLMMEARKVQKVGYSTLIVSLPKDWVEEVGLKQGDIVTFRRESDGGITVYPGLTKERENHRYMIDADLCDGPNLLTRIITANYLTGHDTIQITSKKELSSRHLEEVRGVSRRLTGLGIVEQTLKSVTLQSFVDPTKFPIYGLMRRLQIILSSMLEQAVKSVVEGRMAMADEVLHMEEEADRIYWMIIRQLLLAVLDLGGLGEGRGGEEGRIWGGPGYLKKKKNKAAEGRIKDIERGGDREERSRVGDDPGRDGAEETRATARRQECTCEGWHDASELGDSVE